MICNTRLSLSLLGSSSGESTTPNEAIHQHNKKRKSNKDQELDINPFPSLTLCLSSSAVNSSVISAAVSSFSNSSVKRERDASFEEEVELDTKKVIISPKLDDIDQEQDEDHEYFGTRKKLRLTKEQSVVLEDSFKEHSTLNSKQKRDLATRLSLRPRQVEVWFQNRRARTKLKQTEVDCEILRKCYEDLKDQNRKLNKELQELKSLKMAAPFRVQLSAATLSMCPSCERTYGGGGGGDNSATKISFSIRDQKPNFYGSFANSSAALLS